MSACEGAPCERDERLGLLVTHRRYVPYHQAHYAGNLVDGAFVLGLFGDVATELCIRTDGDEGLFAGYERVRFLAAVRGGDVVEASGRLIRVGRRSRAIEFACQVVCRAVAGASESAAVMLASPIVATVAVGTVVVPVGTVGHD